MRFDLIKTTTKTANFNKDGLTERKRPKGRTLSVSILRGFAVPCSGAV